MVRTRQINAALASEYTVSNNLEGTKAATITGSMKLTDTTSGADVTVYNAGTYNVALGNLSLTGTSAGNYQLELASRNALDDQQEVGRSLQCDAGSGIRHKRQ